MRSVCNRAAAPQLAPPSPSLDLDLPPCRFTWPPRHHPRLIVTMSRPASQSASDRDAKRPRLQAAAAAAGSATVESGSTGAPAAAAAQPTAPQRCPIHALHCILAFLDLTPLQSAPRSCRQWRAAGCSEAPLSRVFGVRISAAAIGNLCATPLRRHIADLSLRVEFALRLHHQLQRLRSLERLTRCSREESADCICLAPALRRFC